MDAEPTPDNQIPDHYPCRALSRARVTGCSHGRITTDQPQARPVTQSALRPAVAGPLRKTPARENLGHLDSKSGPSLLPMQILGGGVRSTACLYFS